MKGSKFVALMLMLAASGYANAELVYPIQPDDYAGGSQYLWGLRKGNVTVKVNPNRGGSIHGIFVAGIGELLNDKDDGRGIGTSGIQLDTGLGLYAESGCAKQVSGTHGNGNTTTVYRTNNGIDSIYAVNTIPKNWNNCLLYPSTIQISHEVSFPSSYDGLIKVKVTITNVSGQTITSYNNQGYKFPLVPQIHIDDAVLHVDPASGWSYRDAYNYWHTQPVRAAQGFLDPNLDFTSPPGHAIEMVRADKSFGLALYAPSFDRGFYAKYIPNDSQNNNLNLNMLASVFNVTPNPIPAGGSASRVYYIAIGPKLTIESVIGWVEQQRQIGAME